MSKKKKKADIYSHPHDDFLRTDRIPHIWCQGCGIGTIFSCLITGIKKTGYSMNDIAIVSGIGCTGRMAGYLKVDSYHTTHGRALPFATGLKLAKPDGSVIVASGDGDLFAIGGNHLIHAARRNIDMTVICVNNFNYGMTGGQLAPSTPFGAKTTTSIIGCPEEPFNFCHIAAACGAVYVARWTALHLRRLTNSISKAMEKRGFSFVEVLAPCPTSFGRYNKMRKSLDIIKFYHKKSIIRNNINPLEAEVNFNTNIVVGEFVDIERPTFIDNYSLVNSRELGEWPVLERMADSPEEKATG